MIKYIEVEQDLCDDENHRWAHNDDYAYAGHWYCLVCALAVDESVSDN